MTTNDKVSGSVGGISITGTILGLATDCGVRMWIVLLDQPIHRYGPRFSPGYDDEGRMTWRALVLPESLLTKVDDA